MISMVPPYAWPRSIADLRDSSLNPDSFTPVDGTGYTPTGLDMGDPRMAGVFELGLRIADTMEKRVAVMEAIRQSVYGFRGIPAAYAWPQSAEQLRSRGLYPDTCSRSIKAFRRGCCAVRPAGGAYGTDTWKQCNSCRGSCIWRTAVQAVF